MDAMVKQHHHCCSDKRKNVLQCRGFITIRKHVGFSDRPCRLYDCSKMRFEGVDDAVVLHMTCGCMPLSGELHKKVIELSPRDNRGDILSVSIKCLQEPSDGNDYMFGSGANAAHRGAGAFDNNQQSSFKGVYQQINNFRSRALPNPD